MKIAIIVTAFPALSETFILEQIIGIIQAGHSVEIFAQTGTTRKKIHGDTDKFGLRRYTHYFPKMPASRIVRVLKAFWLGLCNFHKSSAMIKRAFDFKKFNTVRQIYTLIPFLGKNFDVIHCHFGPNGIIGTDLKLLGVKGKILTSFHGYDVNNYPMTFGRDVYRGLFAIGDFFTANTQFTKNQALELGGQDDKIEILHEGFNIEKFQFAKKEIEPGQEIKLLSVGRLVEKKGHTYSLLALAQIYKKHKNISLTIAGDGPLLNSLQAQAESLGIKDIVNFVGNVDQLQAAELYAQSHIFMLPSITSKNFDREGQALVLQEAQACGLPILATLHNGIPEGVIDGKTAYLVPEKDVDALANKLEYLINNQQIWQQVGHAGREFVERFFTSKILNRQLIELYKRIIEFY